MEIMETEFKETNIYREGLNVIPVNSAIIFIFVIFSYPK